MTDTEQQTADQATEAPRRRNLAEERMTPVTDTTASDNWKIDNEDFRRAVHTGEFAQEPEPASEPEPKQDQSAE